MFRLCARLMFRLCSIYVSAVLDLCFVSLHKNRVCFHCGQLMFRPCSTYVSAVLDLCFNFLNQNWVCSNCDRHMFRPCLTTFRLSSTYFSVFWTKHFFLIEICSDFRDICFDFLHQNRVRFDFLLD